MNGILCISSKNDISLDTYLNYLDYIQHRGTQSFGYLNDYIIHIDGLIHDYKNYDNFTSKIFKDDKMIIEGVGKSKKKAEQDVSRKALIHFNVLT